MSINIFLVEDRELLRNSITALLQDQPAIEVAGTARSGQELFFSLQAPFPELVIMGLNQPIPAGIENVKRLKKEFPQVKLLLLVMHDYESSLTELLDACAEGYMLQNPGREELLFAVNKITSGGIYIAAELTRSLFTAHKAMVNNSVLTPKADIRITPREMEVLQFIADGLTNIEIARTLFTSVRTIETRRKNLLEKTNTTNTATLIRFAIINRLIK